MWSTHCVLLDVFCSPCFISEVRELCAKITIKTAAAPSDKWQHKNNSFNIGPWKKVQLCSPSSVYPLKKNIFLLSICLFVCLSAWAGRSGVEPLCVFVHFFSFGQQSVSTQMTGTNKKSGSMDPWSISAVPQVIRMISWAYTQFGFGQHGALFCGPFRWEAMSIQASYCIVKIMPPKSQGQLQY